MRSHPRFNLSCIGLFLAFLCSSLTAAEPALTPPITPLGPEGFSTLREIYDIDHTIPLDVRLVEKAPKDGLLREKLVFRGAQGFLVPAYFQLPPQGTGPFPCVLLMHGWSGSKEHWWTDDNYISGGNIRKALLQAGYAILALDAQAHGDRIAVNDYAPVNHFQDPALGPEQRKGYFTQREIYIQTTRDYRRAIDYLLKRPEIDPTRLGVFGYSMGGAQAYLLCGTDDRLKCAVSCCAPRDPIPFSPIAPQNFLPGLERIPFLAIMGRHDELCPLSHAVNLHELNPSPRKELLILEAGHKFPKEYVPSAVEWFRARL